MPIGFSTTEGVDQTASQFGIKGVSTAGTQPEVEALVEYVNRNGGLAGRQVAPVLYGFNVYAGTYASQAQAACARWTEDTKVFAAVVATGDLDKDTLVSCLSSRGVPLLKSAAVLYDRTFGERFRGYFYQPAFLWGDRWRAVVDGWVGQGLFASGGRIGIVRIDAPEHERTTNQVVKPRLAAHGLRVEEEVTVGEFRATSDVGPRETEVANAVLRFRAAQVTQVLFVDVAPTLPLLFMTSAESQNYRPRYGIASVTAAVLEANAPKAQLRGAVGVGWAPAGDVNLPQAPPPNQAKQLCLKVFKDRGITHTDALALGTALNLCSHVLFLKTALDRASEFSPAGLLRAVEGLGPAFESPSTFATFFGPGRYDGVRAVRPYTYDEGCACFRFVGSLMPAP